jgi:hypothetical protein
MKDPLPCLLLFPFLLLFLLQALFGVRERPPITDPTDPKTAAAAVRVDPVEPVLPSHGLPVRPLVPVAPSTRAR